MERELAEIKDFLLDEYVEIKRIFGLTDELDEHVEFFVNLSIAIAAVLCVSFYKFLLVLLIILVYLLL